MYTGINVLFCPIAMQIRDVEMHCAGREQLVSILVLHPQSHCFSSKLFSILVKYAFSYPNLPTENCLLYYTKNYTHRSSTYLVFLLKKYSCIENAAIKKIFKWTWKNLLQVMEKIDLWESHDVHSKRTCSTDSLQVPQSGHSCHPLLLVCLPNSSNSLWVPEQNLKNNLEGAPFMYSKYSSNLISHFTSL